MVAWGETVKVPHTWCTRIGLLSTRTTTAASSIGKMSTAAPRRTWAKIKDLILNSCEVSLLRHSLMCYRVLYIKRVTKADLGDCQGFLYSEYTPAKSWQTELARSRDSSVCLPKLGQVLSQKKKSILKRDFYLSVQIFSFHHSTFRNGMTLRGARCTRATSTTRVARAARSTRLRARDRLLHTSRP